MKVFIYPEYTQAYYTGNYRQIAIYYLSIRNHVILAQHYLSILNHIIILIKHYVFSKHNQQGHQHDM